MNQILVTQKLYVTPELKRKKVLYKFELFISIFLICFLFSYYIYAEYDRNKSEQVSKEILAQIKYQEDDTTKEVDNDKIVVILEIPKTKEQIEEEKKAEAAKEAAKKEAREKIDTNTYVSNDGIKYTTEAVLKIPSIKIEYPVLSETSPDLLYVSLNKYWGPKPNEVGNYCIVGHYYESGKMFGKLHKLKNGDIAELTDLSGETVKYQVYNKYIVEPTDTSCTSQKTQLKNGTRELTLITCTNHGKQRLVVKLREIK